jgi:Lon protease-like protein
MTEHMQSTLALFPLSTVLFPNEPLNLNIFEPRYKKLIRERVDQDPIFGVVLIREGLEVGDTPDIHTVGTAARLEAIVQHPDDRYSIALLGTDRFRVLTTHLDAEYLSGDVEWIVDESPAEKSIEELSDLVRDEFVGYVDMIARGLGDAQAQRELRELIIESLSADPETRSFQIASNLPSNSWQKQALLEIGGTHERLSTMLQVIRRERQMLKVAGPTVATDFRFDRAFSAN